MSKRRGYLSPFAGATRFRNLFDSNFYKIGLSKVYVTLQLDQRLDAVWEGEKIWGSFDASLRYRGLNFKIFTVPTELNFLPSGGIDRKYFVSTQNETFLYDGATRPHIGVTVFVPLASPFGMITWLEFAKKLAHGLVPVRFNINTVPKTIFFLGWAPVLTHYP